MSIENPTHEDFICATHVVNALRKAYGSADLEDMLNEDEMPSYRSCLAVINAYKTRLEMSRRRAGRDR